MFLEYFKDQNEWQHHRATTNISLPWYLAEKTESQNEITFQAIKWEWLIFTKNVSGKMFLECYKDQNEWEHHRATTNISRSWYSAEKTESQKRNYVSGHKWERLIFTKNVFNVSRYQPQM